MKRSLLVGVLIFCATLACGSLVFAGNHPQKHTYTMRLVIAHDPAPAYYVQAMKHFATNVERETNGNVKVQILTTTQYGTIDLKQIVDNVQDGKVEMGACTVSTLGYKERDLWALEMPYMFSNYDQVARTIDGQVGQGLLAKLDKHNIKGLAYTYSGGFKVVGSTKPLRTPSDFNGMTVLCHDPVNRAIFHSLGAKDISASYTKTPSLMKSGKIQASDLTYTRFAEYSGGSKYVCELDHSFFLTALIINEKFFNGLPTEYRAVVAKEAKAVALEERAATIHETELIRTRLTAKGIHIITLSASQKAKLQQVTSVVYQQAQTKHFFTAGLIEQIKAQRVATTAAK